MVWYRWNTTIDDRQKQANHIVVACNWSSSVTHEKYEIQNMPCNGRWYEWLNNDKEYLVENNKLTVENFSDHSARIFIYEARKGDVENRSSA